MITRNHIKRILTGKAVDKDVVQVSEPAISQCFQPAAVANDNEHFDFGRVADWKSAIQQTGSLRYDLAAPRSGAKNHIKRVVIAVLGGTVLALGIVLIVLPGPAFLVIPAGLAILAIEFAWARRWLRSARALLPRRSKDDSVPRKKFTMKSVCRNASFLLRRVLQTLLPKRKNT